MDKIKTEITSLVKEHNTINKPYIAFHANDNLIITCFTEEPRTRKVIATVKEAKEFIKKVCY